MNRNRFVFSLQDLKVKFHGLVCSKVDENLDGCFSSESTTSYYKSS